MRRPDMRKSIKGLTALIQASLQLDPFCPVVFVVCDQERDMEAPVLGTQRFLVVLSTAGMRPIRLAGAQGWRDLTLTLFLYEPTRERDITVEWPERR